MRYKFAQLRPSGADSQLRAAGSRPQAEAQNLRMVFAHTSTDSLTDPEGGGGGSLEYLRVLESYLERWEAKPIILFNFRVCKSLPSLSADQQEPRIKTTAARSS